MSSTSLRKKDNQENYQSSEELLPQVTGERTTHHRPKNTRHSIHKIKEISEKNETPFQRLERLHNTDCHN